MRKLGTILLLVFSCAASAQYKLQLEIVAPAYQDAANPVYVAGSFNNWNPSGQKMVLTDARLKKYVATVMLPAGRHEFKITRGSWETVESGNAGFPTENHTVVLSGDTTIVITIAHWADHFPKAPKRSSAHARVQTMMVDMLVDASWQKRRVWVYLPASYATSKRKYPVLYMHDGQNVFEDTTSFSGEWGVDEAMDSLEKTFGEMIVVAIDNAGPKRLNEYSPYDMERYGKGDGDRYVDFIVRDLKPLIYHAFRASRKGRDTYIAGSSMGGLISLYAILKYPKEFGGAGIFSPAFWIAPSIRDAVAKKGRKVKGRVYFYAGMQESETMVPDMLAVFNTLHRKSKARMEAVIRSNGKHNEATWRAEFPLFYKWLNN